MKRELDPFESKLKEKLQGKATFPEDILWKRLNDELLRTDQHVAPKIAIGFLEQLYLFSFHWEQVTTSVFDKKLPDKLQPTPSIQARN